MNSVCYPRYNSENIAVLTDYTLPGIQQIFNRARLEAPCVLILEDLDSLVQDGNRSFFLNEVDGLEDNDGILLVRYTHPFEKDCLNNVSQIGTTNHFERLDPALSSRPSRFDRK